MLALELQPSHLRGLLALLRAKVPDSEVWAYGSRVTGQGHEGSDLDLVLRNPGQLDVPQGSLTGLRDALMESDLPILVEVLDWARIPEEFRQEIRSRHVVVMSPEPSTAR